MNKRNFLIVILFLLASITFADENKIIVLNQKPTHYELISTSDAWEMIKLDTTNGKISLVIIDSNPSCTKEVWVNDKNLISEDSSQEVGRFSLTPNKDRWWFYILTDTKTGEIWHVVTDRNPKKCSITKIDSNINNTKQ